MCILLVAIVYAIYKIFYLVKLRKVEKTDIKTIKQFIKLDFPDYTLDLKLELNFDYIKTISKKFLKYSKNLPIDHNLEFNKNQIQKINNIVKDRKTDSKANQLYEYYTLSLEVLKVINKYYNSDGLKK